MRDRDRERAEFEPVGEDSTIPDADDITATDDGSYDHGEDAVATSTAGYPDERDEDPSVHKCRSCHAPIPTGRMTCDFCLINQIDLSDAAEPPDGERTLMGIIHAVVTAEDKPNAITTATAAFNTLTADPATTDVPGIDEYELLANGTGETARQLAREWGQLPDAVILESLDGQRLLDTVRQNTADGAERDERELEPVVFDAGGEPITGHDELTELLERGSLDRTTTAQRRYRTLDTDKQSTWIVPAFALQDDDIGEDQSETAQYDRPTRCLLSCSECESETEHVFSGSQELPDPAWSGDPIWECTHCGTPRFGPEPATVDGRSGEANGS
jgi:hypothetical protein